MKSTIQEEVVRWENQNWAVDFENMVIYEIQEKEVVCDTLVIYCNSKSNDSRNFTTVEEATGIEQIRNFVDSHFF